MTIQELEEYFSGKELPQSIQTHRAIKITDVRKFVDGHIAVLKQNGEGKAYSLFEKRLLELKEILDGVTPPYDPLIHHN